MPSTEMIDQLQAEVMRKRQELTQLEQALALLKGEALLVTPSGAMLPKSDFSGLRITEAAKRFIAEMGAPQDTAAIADALTKRGLETKSKNFTATVYATLDNSSAFKRVDGKWQYVEGASSRK
jgi:hypothetical protein